MVKLRNKDNPKNQQETALIIVNPS